MHRDRVTVKNDQPHRVTLGIEPWAEEIELDPDRTLEVLGRSPKPGSLEVQRDSDGIKVWGWEGSTVEVRLGGNVVWASMHEVPDLPPGTSTRGFLDMLGMGQRPPERHT